MQAVIYATIKRSAAMREVVINKKTNLLQLEEHFYQLVDVEEPNVFHNLFPYSEIPKIAFNDRIVPHNMPENIWITDTTFRDGQQSRAPYTTEQIVTIYDYLHKLGGPKGLVRQSEFFLYSKKVQVPGGYELDPCKQTGFPAGEGHRTQRDRYSGKLLGLSYFL